MSGAQKGVVAWARQVYVRPVNAPEPAEEWDELVDIEFYNRPEKPEGEGWRPLVLADTRDGTAPLPRINVKCETVDNGIAGVAFLKVIRVEQEDDGSLTAVIDQKPVTVERAREALEQWRQTTRSMESAIDAAQPQASTTLEEAASHARVCSGLAEQHKSDPVLFAALTDAAAIIRDLMRELRGETEHERVMVELRKLSEELKENAAALRRDGVWGCCVGTYMYAAAHIDAIVRESEAQEDAKARLLVDERDVLKSENARLREALQAIVDEVSDGLVPYSLDSYLPAHLVEQARAALSIKEYLLPNT